MQIVWYGASMNDEPEAYTLGWIPFLGLRIELDSRPLIPRPETEWWTEELVTEIGERPSRVLDLCAGSGAIGLSVLAKCQNAHVSFGELVPEHVEQIIKNLAVNALDESRARVEVSDLFAAFKGEKFDVIACNPPYIPEGRTLDTSVIDWEPREALFSGPDGLDLIRKVAKEAPGHMNAGGQLWCEVDSPRASDAREVFEHSGAKQVELRNDQYGRARLVVAHY